MKNSVKLNSKKSRISNQREKRLLNTKNSLKQSSDVLVSAVISPYLLTHLHQILQKSEFNAKQDGRLSHAANFAKLRKVLCLDARSMEDASAQEIIDPDNDLLFNTKNVQNVA
tara:strand:+ start:878 stop:1216 length:339 start_codon:yes stop_codon:yes gene_type:complete